jgi:hypothetical protein
MVVYKMPETNQGNFDVNIFKHLVLPKKPLSISRKSLNHAKLRNSIKKCKFESNVGYTETQLKNNYMRKASMITHMQRQAR